MQPLFREIVFVRAGREADFVVRVVLLNEILNDGAGFPDREVAVVGVDERRQTAVRVHFDILGALDFPEWDVDDLVRKSQSSQDYYHFVGVRSVDFPIDGEGLKVGHDSNGMVRGLEMIL